MDFDAWSQSQFVWVSQPKKRDGNTEVCFVSIAVLAV